jgi:hypothetical protein
MSSKAAALPDIKGENEPSMEEILASIRKIIADDSLGTKKDEPAPKKPAAKKPEPEPEPVVEDDVLDLAEVAVVAGGPQEVDVPPEPEALADPVEMDFEPVAVMVEPDPPRVVQAAPVQASISAPAPAASMADRIISQQTGSLVSAAFQSLARNTPMPAPGRSLEDVVVDLVRPMLRDWIDTNLPGIVEKMVKAEIERVSRG